MDVDRANKKTSAFVRVGSLAIQFAKLRGACVFATASGDDGLEFFRWLGADAPSTDDAKTWPLPHIRWRRRVSMRFSRWPARRVS
jgi:hypothetical protein